MFDDVAPTATNTPASGKAALPILDNKPLQVGGCPLTGGACTNCGRCTAKGLQELSEVVDNVLNGGKLDTDIFIRMDPLSRRLIEKTTSGNREAIEEVKEALLKIGENIDPESGEMRMKLRDDHLSSTTTPGHEYSTTKLNEVSEHKASDVVTSQVQNLTSDLTGKPGGSTESTLGVNQIGTPTTYEQYLQLQQAATVRSNDVIGQQPAIPNSSVTQNDAQSGRSYVDVSMADTRNEVILHHRSEEFVTQSHSRFDMTPHSHEATVVNSSSMESAKSHVPDTKGEQPTSKSVEVNVARPTETVTASENRDVGDKKQLEKSITNESLTDQVRSQGGASLHSHVVIEGLQSLKESPATRESLHGSVRVTSENIEQALESKKEGVKNPEIRERDTLASKAEREVNPQVQVEKETDAKRPHKASDARDSERAEKEGISGRREETTKRDEKNTGPSEADLRRSDAWLQREASRIERVQSTPSIDSSLSEVRQRTTEVVQTNLAREMEQQAALMQRLAANSVLQASEANRLQSQRSVPQATQVSTVRVHIADDAARTATMRAQVNAAQSTGDSERAARQAGQATGDMEAMRRLQAAIQSRPTNLRNEANTQLLNRITQSVQTRTTQSAVDAMRQQSMRETLQVALRKDPTATLDSMRKAIQEHTIINKLVEQTRQTSLRPSEQIPLLKNLNLILNADQERGAVNIAHRLAQAEKLAAILHADIVKQTAQMDAILKMQQANNSALIATQMARLYEMLLQFENIRQTIDGMNEEWAEMLRELDVERLLQANVQVSDFPKRLRTRTTTMRNWGTDLEERKRRAKAKAVGGAGGPTIEVKASTSKGGAVAAAPRGIAKGNASTTLDTYQRDANHKGRDDEDENSRELVANVT